MMRICLITGNQESGSNGLERLLRQLTIPTGQNTLLETLPLGPGVVGSLHTIRPDVVVLPAPVPLEWQSPNHAVYGLDIAFLIAGGNGYERLATVANQKVVGFVPINPSLEVLNCAIWGLLASRQREESWKRQVGSLQQRLTDRIVIERAKGILVQQLGIPEEEAYKRLRVSSRRQRRQIKDIAQSLLDAQLLLQPDCNGFSGHDLEGGNPLLASDTKPHS
jgi:response regulator NasT